jgi:hypothetical protein
VRVEDVIVVLDALHGAGVSCWVGGGWGVAVLAGRQTREHRDLDLAVDAAGLGECLAVLSDLGYRAETDWLPVRIELRAAGDRWVDVHPVAFDDDGDRQEVRDVRPPPGRRLHPQPERLRHHVGHAAREIQRQPGWSPGVSSETRRPGMMRI